MASTKLLQRALLAGVICALAHTSAQASDNSKSSINVDGLLAFDGGGGVGAGSIIGPAFDGGGAGNGAGGIVGPPPNDGSGGTGGVSASTGSDGTGGGVSISTGLNNGAPPPSDGGGGDGGISI